MNGPTEPMIQLRQAAKRFEARGQVVDALHPTDLDLAAGEVFPGADGNSPSRAHYFTWINNTNEGATAAQTEANLAFFQWLHDEYGMVLDIYAFDAGAIDAPEYYGSTGTRKFKQQFPEGFGTLARQAAGFGGRLGVWLGPDGFGDTDEEKQARIDLLAALCRDHRFGCSRWTPYAASSATGNSRPSSS